MKKIPLIVTATALTMVAAQASARIVEYEITGQAVTTGFYLGFPINGTADIVGLPDSGTTTGFDGTLNVDTEVTRNHRDYLFFSNSGDGSNDVQGYPNQFPVGNDNDGTYGTFDTDTGILKFDFKQTQTNTDPFYSAGSMLIVGSQEIDFDTLSGTTTGHECLYLTPGVNTCGYVGVGAGPRAFANISNMVVDESSGDITFTTLIVDATTEANLTTTWTMRSVPLPAAAWLFGAALLGLAGVKKKQLKAR